MNTISDQEINMATETLLKYNSPAEDFNQAIPVGNGRIGGMIFVMSVYRFAVPFIVVMPTMKRISASMEEAARISGATPLRSTTCSTGGPGRAGSWSPTTIWRPPCR